METSLTILQFKIESKIMHCIQHLNIFFVKKILMYYCPPDWQLKCKDDLVLIENSAKFPPGGWYLQKWRPVFGVSGRPNLCYFGKFHLYLYQNNGKCLQIWVWKYISHFIYVIRNLIEWWKNSNNHQILIYNHTVNQIKKSFLFL